MLIDILVKPGAIGNAYELDMPLIDKWLRSSFVLLATNVAENIMEMNKGEFDVRRDLPNIAPSFENIVIEWSFKDKFLGLVGHYAVVINSCDREKEPGAACWTREFKGIDVRWSCNAFVFKVDKQLGQAIYLGHMFWGVGPHGEFASHHKIISEVPDIVVGEVTPGITCTASNVATKAYAAHGQDQEGASNDLFAISKVPLMSLCFLHAKNVAIQKNEAPSPKMMKAWRKRGKPLFRYHTIVIDQRHARAVGGQPGTPSGAHNAIHICRGHFKRFTPEKPLLGRHVGIYWWPMMVRGSKDEGVVIKNYDLKPEGSGN